MGRQADSSLERMQSERKERSRQRQKDESSLRGLAHCQTVNVKSHNYTQRERESVNRVQQTRERKTRDRERMTENR